MFLGKKIMLQPGQLITGRKVIAEKFNISESKVQRILKLFENEHQIEQQNGNKNRLITVVSWSDYQGSEHQDEQQLNNNRTTTEQQVNTYKNVKNDKNIKPLSPKQVYDEQSIPFRLAKFLLDNIKEFKPDVKDPNLQKWADDMRKLVELDKRDPKQVGEVIQWATRDTFWQSNILSANKLREKYDALTAKMSKTGYKPTEKRPPHLELVTVTPEESERLARAYEGQRNRNAASH